MWDVRYRPLRFSDVLGQEGATQVLKSRLRKGTALDTSYLFSGGHGQGKTTLARILARALLCDSLQDGDPCNACDNCEAILDETSVAFVELDAASRGTIDNVRGIVDELPFVVQGASKRVYLFDEAHRMSRDAQDVLLKPLEDKRMVGIFCTTEPEKIRGPIRSRCEEYAIRKITREDILARMKWVLAQEKVDYEDDAVLTIIDHSGGHVRDILNKLEMIAQLGPVTVEATREHLNLSVVSTFFEILLTLGNPALSVQLVESACDRVGPEEVAAGLAEAAMNSFRLANGMHAEFVSVDRELAKKVHAAFGDKSLIALTQHFVRAQKATRTGLVCDVISCASGIPSTSTSAENARPVIQVSAPAYIPAVASVPSAPAPVLVQEVASTQAQTPTQAPAPKAPVTVAPPPQAMKLAAPPSSKPGVRADGIGNLGQDPLAHTEIDVKGVPAEMPRGAAHQPHTISFKGAHGKKKPQKVLTPAEWKYGFELRLQQLGNKASKIDGDNQ